MSEVNERVASLEEIARHIEEDIRTIKDCLIGNGKPGLLTRLDRLEVSEDRRKWTLRAIVVALIAVIIKGLVPYLTTLTRP